MQGMFSYPDIVVICGEPEYHDAFQDIVINPTTIVEVLSPATEAFDRGEKFTRFQTWNPTLREYVLVSQDQPAVEVFTRQADGKWEYVRYAGLDATVVLPTIRCTLNLVDVYDRVKFPAAE
jgi:Uma2 family endonuclease